VKGAGLATDPPLSLVNLLLLRPNKPAALVRKSSLGGANLALDGGRFFRILKENNLHFGDE